jgi:hypothetical protein
VRYHHTRSGEKVEQKPVCECCGHLVEIHHANPV